jgi:hypothetical protein
MFDITDPNQPRKVFIHSTIDDIADITMTGEWAYMAIRGAQVRALHTVELSECDRCDADFDGNGELDSRDVIRFLSVWAAERGQDCFQGDCSSDQDENGIVDTRDFVLFLNAWAQGCD